MRIKVKTLSRILSCLAVGGFIATVVIAAKETPKAIDVLEEAKEEGLSAPKTALKVAAEYKKTIAVGLLTSACMLGSSHAYIRSNRNLISAYKNLEHAYTAYKAAVVGAVGVAGEAAIRDKIAQENAVEVVQVFDSTSDRLNQFLPGEVGPLLWFYTESEPGKYIYFQATAFDVEQALCFIQQTYNDEFFVSVYEFLIIAGVSKEEAEKIAPKTVGWGAEWITQDFGEALYVPFHFERKEDDVNHPGCYYINFEIEPRCSIEEEEYFN